MRYRVEYLRESTEEDSVCFSRSPRTRHLALAEIQAQAWSGDVARFYGAHGFQIRDLDSNRIVAVETFDILPPRLH